VGAPNRTSGLETTGEIRAYPFELGSLSLLEVFEQASSIAPVNRLLLVLAGPDDAVQEAARQATEEIFGDRILDRFRASAWPGTVRAEAPAPAFIVRYDPEVAERMAAREPLLSEWRGALPEDLCLFSLGQGSPIFCSTTHSGLGILFAPSDPWGRGSEGVPVTGLSLPRTPDLCRRKGLC
jgi:hypothetical protein